MNFNVFNVIISATEEAMVSIVHIQYGDAALFAAATISAGVKPDTHYPFERAV